MKLRYKILWFLSVAFLHYQIYIFAWGWAFGLGENHIEAPTLLSVFLYVVGAPVMYLEPVIFNYFGPYRRWWGDDANLLIGCATANAVVWAFVVTWLVALRQRRRALKKASNQLPEATSGLAPGRGSS